MGEIKTKPIKFIDDNGGPWVLITPDHTWSDVARWIISEGEEVDMVYFLTDGKDSL